MSAEVPSLSMPPDFPDLQPQTIHIWRIPLTHSDDTLLSGDELQRAGRFRFDHHRQRFVAGRQAMRRILAAYLQQDPAALVFKSLAHGKPVLSDEAVLQFNFSNSAGLGLLAVARDLELGVDLESLQKELDPMALVERFFCARELEELRAMPAELRKKAFLTAWTRKEASMKLAGDGLHIPLHDFAVNMHPDESPHLVSGDQVLGGPVALQALDVGPDYVASLACREAGIRAVQFNWQPDSGSTS